MSDIDAEDGNERPAPEAPAPVPLDYFAFYSPRETPGRARAMFWSWAALLGGLAPFACGTVSLRAVHDWTAQPILTGHIIGGALFMALGMLAALASLIAFLRLREWTAALFAGGTLVLQAAVGACAAFGR